MKIRVTGTHKQVKCFLERLHIIAGTKCNYVSKEYPQTRKCKMSKYVSVYIDYEDYNLPD